MSSILQRYTHVALFLFFEIIALVLVVNFIQKQKDIFLHSTSIFSGSILKKSAQLGDYLSLQKSHESLEENVDGLSAEILHYKSELTDRNITISELKLASDGYQRECEHLSQERTKARKEVVSLRQELDSHAEAEKAEPEIYRKCKDHCEHRTDYPGTQNFCEHTEFEVSGLGSHNPDARAGNATDDCL